MAIAFAFPILFPVFCDISAVPLAQGIPPMQYTEPDQKEFLLVSQAGSASTFVQLTGSRLHQVGRCRDRDYQALHPHPAWVPLHRGRPGLSRAPARTPQSPKSHWEVWVGEARGEENETLAAVTDADGGRREGKARVPLWSLWTPLRPPRHGSGCCTGLATP